MAKAAPRRRRRISSEDDQQKQSAQVVDGQRGVLGQEEFVQLLEREYLSKLSISLTRFAEEMGASKAQFYRVVDGSRGITRKMVGRIEWTLRKLFESHSDKQLRDRYGIDGGWWIQPQLLARAGFAMSIELLPEQRDVRWQQIASQEPGHREIKVGWVPCSPWAYVDQRTGREAGSSIAVAEQVLSLLGMRPFWTQLEWEELESAIRSRKVDLIAPFLMEAPYRRLDFRFSRPISEKRSHTYGVSFLILKSERDRGIQRVEDFKDNVEVGYIAREIGQVARHVISSVHDPKEHRTFDDALAWLEVSEGHPKCVASEEQTCKVTASRSQGRLEVIDSNILEDVRFPLCFGAHPGEESLVSAIDGCIRLLETKIHKLLPESNDRQ